ncbi:GM22288 [Drosophila sechellia]|uniref:GM22288 n=1 Tax=Drosophila sechellia TaxID=7238 RepID=B4IA98_DROSE|nr:GM22288 [Drosophila sechellia]
MRSGVILERIESGPQRDWKAEDDVERSRSRRDPEGQDVHSVISSDMPSPGG